jgi:hypothetical protein
MVKMNLLIHISNKLKKKQVLKTFICKVLFPARKLITYNKRTALVLQTIHL